MRDAGYSIKRFGTRMQRIGKIFSSLVSFLKRFW